MQVKKFEADTLKEALEAVKRDLGPEAVILQTKQVKKGWSKLAKTSVEVTAAVSGRALQKKELLDTRMPDPVKSRIQKLPADRQAELINSYSEKKARELKSPETAKKDSVSRITTKRYIDITDEERIPKAKLPPSEAPKDLLKGGLGSRDLAREIDEVKKLVHQLKDTPRLEGTRGSDSLASDYFLKESVLNTPVLQDAFEHLVVNGVNTRLALDLIKQVTFALGRERCNQREEVLDQLAFELMNNSEIISALDGIVPKNGSSDRAPVVIALVGPTGVGKTTTLAKVASQAILNRNLKVALINIDNYKVAAFDQLATYAKILNVPYRSVNSEEDLSLAINDFNHFDLVLVDTTGRSQKDGEALKEMESLVRSIPSVRIHLVLSATTRDTELLDIAHRFKIFRPEGLILSKLDEAVAYGSIYNMSQKFKLPLIYFTTGQRVPEDIEEATRERVAALVMGL